MIRRAYVLSDRYSPWSTSYFVMVGPHIIARGLSWPQALTLARRIAA